MNRPVVLAGLFFVYCKKNKLMIKNFTVYFEIYGKKMRTTVMAKTEKEANDKVRNKIIFHKTVADKEGKLNEAMSGIQELMDILNPKGK